MKSIEHLDKEEQNHFIRCKCGHYYDMRDLGQVIEHMHEENIPEPDWAYSIKKGESVCYTATGKKIDLN